VASSFLLIRGGAVYAPTPLGCVDLLLCAGRVITVGGRIEPPTGLETRVIDAVGCHVVPGFVDLHVHLLGGGGEAGPASRVPELSAATLLNAGVTTVVGALGTDDVARRPEALLAKAHALRVDGVTAHIWTGSYHLPPATITGSVRSDVALIREVVGVKVAISDHRGSQPTDAELARLAADARVGGMLGGRPGLVHVHVGSGREGLDPLIRVAERTDVPIGQFLPTHVNRTEDLLGAGIDFIRRGGAIDLTAPSRTLHWEERLERQIARLAESGVDLRRVSLSSDGNGSMPRFDSSGALVGMGVGDIGSLLSGVRTLVESGCLSVEDALRLVTESPARRIGRYPAKGALGAESDADLLVLDEGWTIRTVIAGGREVAGEGQSRVSEGDG